MALAPRDNATFVPLLDAQTVLACKDARIFDLRSPSEFEEDHLPGALNVPLFDDAERAIVGWLYHRASPERAFQEGLEVVERKIVSLVRAILPGEEFGESHVLERMRALVRDGFQGLEAGLAAGRASKVPTTPTVLYCWRGGLRSRSVVALLAALGAEGVVGLENGYKGYRAHVRAELEGFEPPATFVLRGLTGVGKTLVLRAMQRLRPEWILDLEHAAGHRSSLLGMVGLEPVSQKRFDSRIASRLRGSRAPALVVEGESRKVGDVVIPARLWQAMAGGTNILLEADQERRVEVLLDDYLADPEARPRLREQLARVEERMAGGARDLVGLFDAGRERELVAILLEHYYDPLYLHSEKGKAYALRVDASDPERCAEEISTWIERQLLGHSGKPCA